MKKLYLSLTVLLLATTSISAQIYERTVLIEEFTGEKCSNCPAAANALHEVLTDEDYKGRAIAVSHHAGYGTDSYTTSFDTEFTWFYNGGLYAPAFMFDRYTGGNRAYFDASKYSPVRAGQSASFIKEMIDQRLQKAPKVQLHVESSFSEDEKVIYVKVTGERTAPYCDNERLVVMVTQDSIMTSTQAGSAGRFYHMHVGRAVNDTWGESVEWVDNQFEYVCQFDVLNRWKIVPQYMKVVAYIGNYNAADPNDCTVENAAAAKVGAYGTTAIHTQAAACTETARYTLDGRRLTAPQRGLNLVRMSDGTTRKIFVK